MRKTVGQRLLELKSRSGLSLAEIARLSGFKGASSLQRYFSESYDPAELDYRTAQRLAEAMEGAGEPPINQFDLMALTAAADQQGALPSAVPVQPDKEMRGFIPVYHATHFDYELMELDAPSVVDALEIDFGDAVETLRCPPVLERRQVYGFYMSGLSMRPRFNPGEVVFTDGRRPASVNDDILILLQEDEHDGSERRAIFGRLKEIEKDHLVIEQYLGETFPVHFRQVAAFRRVMQAVELLGGYMI